MELKIFAGRASKQLALAACRAVDAHLGSVEIKSHNDGEIYVRYQEEVRGCDVFIIQSTSQPDSNFRELQIMIQAAKHSSAARVTAVIPYFGYARQDRKAESHEPVTAALDAKMLEAAGVDRTLVMDVHSNVVGGALVARDIITDTLRASPVLVRYLMEEFLPKIDEDLTLGAPDAGATPLARAYAKVLGGLPIAIIDKRRPRHGETEVINIVGIDDVVGNTILLVDDLIDSANTLVNGAAALMDVGAKSVFALATHAVFSGGALERLEKSCIEQVFVTDSVHQNGDLPEKVVVVSVAELIGKAIRRINTNRSISSLLKTQEWVCRR